MKHAMVDMYGVKKDLESTITVNEIMNEMVTVLGLKAVMPPMNIPYYYCPNPADGGVSAFTLLDGGHITLHSFPFYGDLFIDILAEELSEADLRKYIAKTFAPADMHLCFYDRDCGKSGASFNPEKDFGPHLMGVAVREKPLTMNEIYDILEAVPLSIDMHPILRPFVITNRVKDYTVISGITIIAESHIAIHQNIKTGKVYFDIYSCQFCENEKLFNVARKVLGEGALTDLISRGEKQEKTIIKSYSLSDNGWRKNI